MTRIELQPAFLLHHRPYRDTSRILEFFTRDHGRITVFARGARGSASRLAPVLQSFNRLMISWSGRGEAGQLTGAEFDGEVQALAPARLMSGFYLNELMISLLTRHDVHPELFDLYAATLAELKMSAEESRTLRLFERRVLQALGYGISIDYDAVSGAAVEAGAVYRYRTDQGVTLVNGVAEGNLLFSGASLLSLAREELHDAAARMDARRLLRAALDHCLDGRQLRSPEVAAALRSTVR
jgi:DNA repair protein RecO (recombination protein O)